MEAKWDDKHNSTPQGPTSLKSHASHGRSQKPRRAVTDHTRMCVLRWPTCLNINVASGAYWHGLVSPRSLHGAFEHSKHVVCIKRPLTTQVERALQAATSKRFPPLAFGKPPSLCNAKLPNYIVYIIYIRKMVHSNPPPARPRRHPRALLKGLPRVLPALIVLLREGQVEPLEAGTNVSLSGALERK